MPTIVLSIKSKENQTKSDRAGWLEFLRRRLDGTVYAYRCRGCGSAWKIYQQASHIGNCRFNHLAPVK
jgi:hypothetical protein